MGRIEMQWSEPNCGLVKKATGHSTAVTICSAIAGSPSAGNRSRGASACAVDSRTTRVVLIRYSTPVPCVTIDCTSASQARRAISVLSNLTVVSGGSVNSAIWMSSKPTTDMSSGTRSPHWRMARMAPIAVRSLEAMTAVGRGARASRRSIAFSPPSTLLLPSSGAVSRHAPKHGSLHCLGGPRPIVHLDVAHPPAHSAHIQKNQRHLAPGECVLVGRIDFRRHDGYAVDFALDHPLHAQGCPRSVEIGGRHQHVVAVLKRNVLETLEQLRKEGVHDVGDHQAQHVAAPGNQRLRGAVRPVSKLLDHFQHSRRRLRTHL